MTSPWKSLTCGVWRPSRLTSQRVSPSSGSRPGEFSSLRTERGSRVCRPALSSRGNTLGLAVGPPCGAEPFTRGSALTPGSSLGKRVMFSRFLHAGGPLRTPPPARPPAGLREARSAAAARGAVRVRGRVARSHGGGHAPSPAGVSPPPPRSPDPLLPGPAPVSLPAPLPAALPSRPV
ncbi:WW domain-binding protein 11-like [Camelus dromedarius]|uniref:WW domain-binding protein 11-like n=1 Tax=Camelus dromedarius TaxID=9838 RepID=UPI0031196552